MALIDTHSHIYLPEFDEDRNEIVLEAVNKGIQHIFLPNIDSQSIDPMLSLCNKFPKVCYPMIGLHPTSVDKNFENELNIVEKLLTEKHFIGIGECGIDLYWDKTFIKEQEQAFAFQLQLAKKYNLPVIIHARESFKEIYNILEKEWDNTLRGVFHSFTGNMEDVTRINEFGFYFGINGIVTFKNSGLKDAVKHIDINRILLETDAPYLAPVPKRGKRNKSSYLIYIAEKIAEIFNLSFENVSELTTNNAKQLFMI